MEGQTHRARSPSAAHLFRSTRERVHPMKPSLISSTARAHLFAIFLIVFGAAFGLPPLLGDELEDSKKTVAELRAIIALQAAEIAQLKSQISGGVATDAEVENVLQSAIDSESDHRLRLAFFRKVDGVKASGSYYAEIEAEFEAVRPCIWGPEVVGMWEGSFSTSTSNSPQLPMLSGFSGKFLLKSGDRVEFKGTMQLQKAESGWRGSIAEGKLLGYNKPDAITRSGGKAVESPSKSSTTGVEGPKQDRVVYVDVTVENHLKKSIKVSFDGGVPVKIESQQTSSWKYPANSKHQLKLTGSFGVIEKELQIHGDDVLIPVD